MLGLCKIDYFHVAHHGLKLQGEMGARAPPYTSAPKKLLSGCIRLGHWAFVSSLDQDSLPFAQLSDFVP